MLFRSDLNASPPWSATGPPAPSEAGGADKVKPGAALLCVLTLAAACTTSTNAPPPAKRTERLARVRMQAESLLAARTQQQWRSQALGETSASAERSHGRQWLLEPATLALVDDTLATSQSETEQRALGLLRSFLLAESLAQAAAVPWDRAQALRAHSTVQIGDGADGPAVAFEAACTLLANEPKAKRRDEIYEAMLPVIDELEAPLWQAFVARAHQARALGLGHPTNCSHALRGFDAAKVGRLARRALRQTDALYFSLLAEVARAQLDLHHEDMNSQDAGWLFRGAAYDALFSSDALRQTALSTVQALGVAPDPMLSIDTSDHPSKPAGSAAFAVQVPNDVRVSITPRGGVADYRALLGEMGRALLYQHSRSSAFELRHLGDKTVAHAFAVLLRSLMVDATWLRQHTAAESPHLESLIRLGLLEGLYALRRDAAGALFELELHRGLPSEDPRRMRNRYASWMQRGLGIEGGRVAWVRFLSDEAPAFAHCARLRGTLVASQLRRHLQGRFGTQWWSQRAAGLWLADLWKSSPAMTGEELARAAGASSIDARAALDDLTDGLLGPPAQAAAR